MGRGSLESLSIEINKRPDEKSRQRFVGCILQHKGGNNKQQVILLALEWEGLVLKWGGVGGGPVGWAGGVAYVFCPPRGGSLCREPGSTPALAPSTSEVAVGLWPFSVLSFISALIRAVIFQSPVISLYSVAEGDVCPGASTAVKGLRSQPSSPEAEPKMASLKVILGSRCAEHKVANGRREDSPRTCHQVI